MEQAPNAHRAGTAGVRRRRFPLSGKARWSLPYVLAFALIGAAVAAVPAAQRADAQATLDIEQTTIGNVFDKGQVPAFDVSTSESEISWTVHDHWGSKVGTGTEQVSNGSIQLKPAPNAVGYYELTVTAGDGDAAKSAETRYAVMPPVERSDADNFTYAMQTHFAHGWSRELIGLMDKLGVESARDAQQWQSIETGKGQYDFGVFEGRYEKYMAKLEEHGIDPFTQFGIYNANYDNGATPHTEEGQLAYGAFVQEVLSHYGEQIKGIGVYNEPNQGKFGDHGDGPADAQPGNYFNLLKRTDQSIDRQNITVAGPELAAGATRHDAWYPWLKKFFELGGLDYLDVVTVHPYRDRCCPPAHKLEEDLADIRELMKQHGGGNKPIWFTEQGWSSNLVSPETQAAYVPQSITLARSHGVERHYWNALMDVQNGSYGLLRWGKSPYGPFVPKPAYVSYAVMVNQLAAKPFETTDDTPPGVTSLRFGSGNQATRVMWAPDRPRDVALSTQQPLRVTDLMGKTRTLEPVNGVVSLSLSGEPLYVTGPVSEVGQEHPYTIAADDTPISESIQAELRLDNSDGTQAATATYSVLGKDHEVTAPAGEVGTQQIEVPSSDRAGRRVLPAEVTVNGKLTGLAQTDLDVHEDVTMRVRPQVKNVADEKLAVAVELTNHSENTARTVERIQWRVGGSRGTEQPGVTVEPGTTKVVSVDMPGRLTFWKSYPASISTQVAELQELTYDGNLGFNPAHAASPTVDGKLGEYADLPFVNLGRHGKVVEIPDRPPHEGPDDLSGKMWMAADQDNLYIAAQTTDNTFTGANPDEPANAWQADSIQIGLSKGMPGSTGDFYDYTFALGSDDKSIGYRAFAPAGEDVGVVDYQIATKRAEAGKKTRYEVAIPWEDVGQLAPNANVFSLSFLVNDNDGEGRKGWIEWGSGIGQGKDPALFKPVVQTSE